MPMLDKRLDLLYASINSALSQITDISQRVGELESRTNTCETTLSTVHQTTTQHEQLIRQLQDKIEDLENRSRRSNLRFVWIPESIKGEDLTTISNLTTQPKMNTPAFLWQNAGMPHPNFFSVLFVVLLFLVFLCSFIPFCFRCLTLPFPEDAQTIYSRSTSSPACSLGQVTWISIDRVFYSLTNTYGDRMIGHVQG